METGGIHMFTVGRLCVKIAGRDAGKKCVVTEVLDKTFVMIDGETRRRKCNILHLEPTSTLLELKDKASPEDVKHAFNSIGIVLKTTTPKKAGARPRKVRHQLPEMQEQPEKKKAVKEKPAKKEKPKAAKKAKKEKK